MMFRLASPPLLAVALGLASAACPAADKDLPGYRPERAAQAAQWPVYMVTLNERVRPQVGYGGLGPGADIYLYALTWSAIQSTPPNMSNGQAIVGGALGGAIGGAIIGAAMHAAARDDASQGLAVLERDGCDFPIGTPLRDTVRAAVVRSPWGANAQPVLIDGSVEGWEKQIPQDRPRQVFTLTSSMAPGFEALVTTVDAAAYAPETGANGDAWQKKPLWRDHLVVVSEPVVLPAKTQADIDRMVAEENARFAASGDIEVIDRVAKDRYGSSKADRSRAVAANSRHQTYLRFAQSKGWAPTELGRRRAELWTRDQCAPMRAAAALAIAESTRLLDDLYAQRLPSRLALKDKTEPEPAGARAIRSLPGGLYVSRSDGGATTLGFRYNLLPLKD